MDILQGKRRLQQSIKFIEIGLERDYSEETKRVLRQLKKRKLEQLHTLEQAEAILNSFEFMDRRLNER